MKKAQSTRTVAALLALVATFGLLASCSSDDGESGSGDAQGTPEQQAAASAIEQTQDMTFTGDQNSEFCDLTREIVASNPQPTQEGLLAFVDGAIDNQDRWTSSAPSEIASDIDVYIAEMETLRAILASSDFNQSDLADESSDLNTALNEPEFRVATERITKYMTDVCDPQVPEQEGEVPEPGEPLHGDVEAEDAPDGGVDSEQPAPDQDDVEGE